MKRADSVESFVADPVGAWIAAGTHVTWCASPSLAGTTTWGNPDVATTRTIMRTFEALWADTLDDVVDVVMDATRIEGIAPDALVVLLEWNVARRADLTRRIRQQIGVIPRGLVGVTLSGVLPVAGAEHPFSIVHDPLDAHRAVGSEATLRAVDAIVEEVSGVAPQLLALRDVLRSRHAAITLADCARALGSSTRSLQRALGTLGTSFQRELRDARFAEARTLLMTTDEKVASIANRVGVTESALTQLVRERTGQTPAELRRRS